MKQFLIKSGLIFSAILLFSSCSKDENFEQSSQNVVNSTTFRTTDISEYVDLFEDLYGKDGYLVKESEEIKSEEVYYVSMVIDGANTLGYLVECPNLNTKVYVQWDQVAKTAIMHDVPNKTKTTHDLANDPFYSDLGLNTNEPDEQVYGKRYFMGSHLSNVGDYVQSNGLCLTQGTVTSYMLWIETSSHTVTFGGYHTCP